MPRRSQFDDRAGSDALYDATAAEVKSPKPSYPISPLRFAAWATALAVYAVILGGFVWVASTVTQRTVFNWMDGYGFTPISHAREYSPTRYHIEWPVPGAAHWVADDGVSPASGTFTWTLPGEVAQP